MSETIMWEGNEYGIRRISVAGVMMYVVTDACRVVDIANPSQAVRDRLDPADWRRVVVPAGVPGRGRGAPELLVCTEVGLMDLLASVRTDAARELRRRVLASVREAGRREGAAHGASVGTVEAPRLLPGAPLRPGWRDDPAIARVAALMDTAVRLALDRMPSRTKPAQIAKATMTIMTSFIGAFPLAGSSLHEQLAHLERALYDHELDEGQRLIDRLYWRAMEFPCACACAEPPSPPKAATPIEPRPAEPPPSPPPPPKPLPRPPGYIGEEI